MKVDILNLQQLFGRPGRYEIPPFQRAYVWNRREQWGPLWEDVQKKAEQYLETSPDQHTSHFLGSVVLQQKLVPAGQLMTRVVVDGQQRLTTLQLLLDAVQEVFEERGYTHAAKRLEILVLNQEAFLDDNQDHVSKVWPTLQDQDAFRHAMHNDLSSSEHEKSLIVRAHRFFKSEVGKWLGPRRQQDGMGRMAALEHAVTSLLEVVVIDLDQAEDPHLIFETLNARGTPLLQSDLVKNMVLFEAGKTGIASDSDDAVRLWGLTDNWWRKEIRQGRLRRPRIDVFLNYWMVMRKCKEVKANEVFSEFSDYYKEEGRPIEDIASDIGRVAEFYRSLEEAALPDMVTFLYRWRVMQAGVLTPVLLWLLSSDVSRPQLKKSLRALESYLVRRMICRMTTTKNYNRLFFVLLDSLRTAGAERAGDTIVRCLGDQNSEVSIWPNDQQIADAFVNQPLYRQLPRGRLRILLEGMEEELRTDKAESDSVPRNLTIEHIMPQQWRENWGLQQVPSSLEVESEIEATERRNSLIHSIGNLTLVNEKLNPALSNAPWEEKRAGLDEHTTMFLNKDLIAGAPDVWDEAAIAERAKRLSRVAARVWPHADKI